MPCYSLALNCPSQAHVWEAWPSLVRMGGGTFKRGPVGESLGVSSILLPFLSPAVL